MTAALEGGEWSAARPGRTLPPGKTRYPFYRRLGGPQGQSGREENLVPNGIRSRTVQPVAQSLYRLSYPAHVFDGCTPKFEFEFHDWKFGGEWINGRRISVVWYRQGRRSTRWRTCPTATVLHHRYHVDCPGIESDYRQYCLSPASHNKKVSFL